MLHLAISGILAGCTFDVPVQPSEAQEASMPDAAMVLPLTVGLYFSDEFRHLKKDAPFYGGPAVTHHYEFPIGEASVRRWEEFATQLFAQVGIVTSLPGTAATLETANRAAIDRERIERELEQLEADAAKLRQKCLIGEGSWRALPECVDYEDHQAVKIARLEAELMTLQNQNRSSTTITTTPDSERPLEVSHWLDRYAMKVRQIDRETAAQQTDAGRLRQKCLSGEGSWRALPECVDYEAKLAAYDEEKQARLAALESERAGLVGPPPLLDDIRLILAPTIEHVSVRVPVGYAWLGNYWVEVIYGIRLYSVDGKPIANWRVTGRGTNTDGIDFFGTHRLPSQAMDEAILDAGGAFMAGFALQPAAASWLAANLTPAERQQACDTPEGLRVDGSMPSNTTTSPAGLAVGVELLASPERQQSLIGTTIGNQQILAARLVLRNGADSTWIVRRADLRLRTASGRDIAPLDGRLLILGTDDIVYFEPAMVVDAGTTLSGIAAGLNVLGLIVASAAASERKNLLAILREREYDGSCLAPGAAAAGIVYFALPPDTPRDDLELVVSAHTMPGNETASIHVALEELGMPMADEMAE